MKKTLLYILLSTTLFAHPHTFIDVYPTLSVKNSIAKKINFRWKIDEMTSSMLIMDVDLNGDSKIDKNEDDYIRDNYFTVFADYDFYTFIKVDGKVIPFPKVQDFKATIENNCMVYSFDIYGEFNVNNTTIEFGDTDFYVALVLKDEFINITGAKAKALGVDNDFYYGYKLEFIK